MNMGYLKSGSNGDLELPESDTLAYEEWRKRRFTYLNREEVENLTCNELRDRLTEALKKEFVFEGNNPFYIRAWSRRAKRWVTFDLCRRERAQRRVAEVCLGNIFMYVSYLFGGVEPKCYTVRKTKFSQREYVMDLPDQLRILERCFVEALLRANREKSPWVGRAQQVTLS